MSSEIIRRGDLTPEEAGHLTQLESVVERGMQTFVEVGLALMEIRDARLYRGTHASFESYLDKRWGMSRGNGYRMIDAALVAELVSPIGDIANEAQARELAPLLREDEQAIIEVVRDLRAEYGAEKVTAKKVRGYVKRRLERVKREEAIERKREEHAARALVRPARRPGETVIYQSPRDALLMDSARIEAKLEEERARRLRVFSKSWKRLEYVVDESWMPWISILDAVRGRTFDFRWGRKKAEDLLAPVNRYLFEHEDVIDIVKRIDAAFEAERLSFVADLDAFLAERSVQIGETVAPLVDELRDLADSLPDDGLELAVHVTFASGGTGIRGDIRDCSVADELARKQGLA